VTVEERTGVVPCKPDCSFCKENNWHAEWVKSESSLSFELWREYYAIFNTPIYGQYGQVPGREEGLRAGQELNRLMRDRLMGFYEKADEAKIRESNEMDKAVCVAVSVNETTEEEVLFDAIGELETALKGVCRLMQKKARAKSDKWENRAQGVGAFYDPDSGHLRLT